MLRLDGRCRSGREIASSNVKGVFLADGTAKAMRCLCTHSQKHFLSSKCTFQSGRSLEQDTNVIPLEP
jgi:hypothetical protein